jgi:hypothetical protein
MSNSSSSSSASGGIGLGGIVFIVFLVLKLAEIGPVATWSWWWVTCPLWGPVVLVLGIITVVFLVSLTVIGIAALCGKKINIKKKNLTFTLDKR